MTAFDPDPLLRRLERRAVWFCACAAVLALLVRRGQPDVAFGVVGGGLLAAISYWAIRSSIDGLVRVALGRSGAEPEADRARWRRGAGDMLRFASRYLVLGVVAYVLLVVARLHPLGMMVGVSALVVAAAVEAAQWVLTPRG